MNELNEVFFEDFENREEVEDQFRIKLSPSIKILFAFYENESYEGEAFVLFKENGILYEVNGAHCSCDGLEDQWEPEETTKDSIMHRLEKGRSLHKYAKEIKAILENET